MNKTIVIIPTYNEINNISELVKSILNINSQLNLLFIDDNSPDGTGDFLKEISQQQKNIHIFRFY